MHNPGDDNELDQLSREAADKYEAPGHSSWDSLERELDKVLPVTEKRKKRFLFFWWLIPCLLLGGVAYWWLEQSNKPAVPMPVTGYRLPATQRPVTKQTDLKTTIIATMKEEGEKNQPITSYAGF
ncbi:MAG: hypothetical protein NVS3B15_10570 [Sediminibacterium sp.]